MGVVIDGCDGSDVETAGPLSRVGNTNVTSQIIATQDSIYTTSSDVDLVVNMRLTNTCSSSYPSTVDGHH